MDLNLEKGYDQNTNEDDALSPRDNAKNHPEIPNLTSFLPEQYRPYSSYIFIILSSVFAGLGNSLEPVSILAVLHLFFFVAAIDEVVTGPVDWKWWTSFILLESAGFCLGFSGIFGYPHSTALTVATCFAFGILLWVVITLFVVIPYRAYLAYQPTNSLSIIFIFPILQTMVTCSFVGNIFSTFSVVGNALGLS
jgi:hypothetical protein